MTFNGNLEEFVCAFSNKQHYLKDPMKLPDCKHSVCKKCVELKTIDQNCKICNVLVSGNIVEENEDLKKSIHKGFKTLMEIIGNQTNQQIIKLKSQ